MPAEGAPEQFIVVGVGASAGGITALQSLFAQIPATASNIAFIVVQHSLPSERSRLADLFRGWTKLSVAVASDGVVLAPGHVYIASPGHALGLANGAFTTRPAQGEGVRPGIDSIDAVFELLADRFGPRAIAVVLSGTGSDGAAGALCLKEAGGLVLVQDPTTAMHDGMPNAVIANGAADHIMPLGPLAHEIVASAAPDYVRSTSASQWADEVTIAVDGMIDLIRTKAGFDLTGYKRSPLLWRIQRRMQLRRVPRFRDYESLLHDDPAELDSLVRAMPIHVTSFFRDTALWSRLQETVIPAVFAGRADSDKTVRAWTPACSTGEEAYSVAMLLAEHDERAQFQVFATDASAEIAARASRGVFKAASVNELTPERRRRFFYAADGSFRVQRSLREKMVFAPQDLLADPPFTRLDIVTCRNLLIYLEPDATKRVLYLLHSSLRVGGFLFLGKSESLPKKQRGFVEVDGHARIYQKTNDPWDGELDFPRRPKGIRPLHSSESAIEAHSHEAAVAERDVPAVVVDDHFRIVRLYGDTSAFLHFKAGEPSLDALELLPPVLARRVEHAARAAQEQRASVTVEGQLDASTGKPALHVRVTPLQTASSDDSRLLVSFLRAHVDVDVDDHAARSGAARASQDGEFSEALRQSHAELESSREELQALNEELRAANDQLNSANDDLNAANARLQEKLDELETQKNVLSSGAVITLFLDGDLRMRFFTPGINEMFPVWATDVGRRITDFAPKFDHPGFLDQVKQVMHTDEQREAEIKTLAGRWYLQRIRPFLGSEAEDGERAGVAITFTDITERKAAAEALRATNERIRKLVALMPAGVYACDVDGRITFFNERAIELWGREPRLADVPAMADAVTLGRSARDLEAVIEQPSGARVVASMNVDPLYDGDGKPAGAINVFVDVSERRRAQDLLQQSEAALAAELEAMRQLHAFSLAAKEVRKASDLAELALDALLTLHGTDRGSVQLFEPKEETLRLVAQRGFAPWFREKLACVDASEASKSARAMAKHARTMFEDTERDQPDLDERADAAHAGYRATQSTPLTSSSGAPLGLVSTHFADPKKLSGAEGRASDILATEFSIALDRISAEDALAERDAALRRNQAWLAAQNEAFKAAMNGAPLEASLGILTRAAVDTAESERRCAFYIAADDDKTLKHVVGMGDSYARAVDGFEISPESLACGLAVATGEPVLTKDVVEEPRWQPWLWLAREYNYRGCWSFPVATSAGKRVGSFAIYCAEPREPTSSDRDLAAMWTQTAAIIIARQKER